MTDDYRASDIAWLEMKDNTIDFIVEKRWKTGITAGFTFYYYHVHVKIDKKDFDLSI